MVMMRSNPINLHVQGQKIRKLFPKSRINIIRNKLICKLTLTPTPLSKSYDIKIIYKHGSNPDVFVINEKLDLYPGKKNLPHVYSTKSQHICLYYRKAHEWKDREFIADTIIPWMSEWLFHYEIWLAIGDWFGRGIHGKQEPYKKPKKS